jgi:hypothetical protein
LPDVIKDRAHARKDPNIEAKPLSWTRQASAYILINPMRESPTHFIPYHNAILMGSTAKHKMVSVIVSKTPSVLFY